MRNYFYLLSFFIITITLGLSYWVPWILWSFIVTLPLIVIGVKDCLQDKKAILKNFPVLGRLRYFFEAIRPEIQQYFVEYDDNGTPFNRIMRSVVYQRAKNVKDTVPFGTKLNVNAVGYEWINHSLNAYTTEDHNPRIVVGNKDCTQPYDCSLLNIAAMSYGSLSQNAVMALNEGAKMGHFAHNTGEGGIAPYHLRGGDLIWQIGTGYFGARNSEGGFDDDLYRENANRPEVKMIELKLSQGAKPGHGGILPAQKVTEEISKIRNVPMGKDVLSPPGHKEFNTPIGLIKFIKKLRKLSGGKPVGFKLCIGKLSEFMAICRAMIELDCYPDFIAVDGGEGGTGAAPLEFSNAIGTPSNEGISFVHSTLTALGIRQHIKILGSGKVVTGFDIVKKLALGADVCYAARSMMLALGCIQALKCNSNECPVGVATQEKGLMKGLVVSEKNKRVAMYHKNSMHSFMEILAAAGLNKPSEVKPYHINKRIEVDKVMNFDELFVFLKRGDLESDKSPKKWRAAWDRSSSQNF